MSAIVKHTAGPWHWDSDPIKDDPTGRVRYRVVAKGRTITQCYYPSGDGFAEHDTRLIAAAPELLEALDDLLNDCINFDGGKLTDHFLIKATHAIAKAKGIPDDERDGAVGSAATA